LTFACRGDVSRRSHHMRDEDGNSPKAIVDGTLDTWCDRSQLTLAMSIAEWERIVKAQAGQELRRIIEQNAAPSYLP